MSDDEGLRVVLSPLQLSAMLLGGEINAHEMMVNRFWGAVKVAGGALEMVTGSALLVTPEPTMVTKVGGVLLAAHGIDNASSGLRELWTGAPDKTLTQRAGEGVAYQLGANQAQAERTGIVLDVAVPLVVAGVVGCGAPHERPGGAYRLGRTRRDGRTYHPQACRQDRSGVEGEARRRTSSACC